MLLSAPEGPHGTEKTEDSKEEGIAAVYDACQDVSRVDEAKLVRKMDWRLLPWLSFLHLLSFLDRVSIGNAKVRQPAPRSWPASDNSSLRGLDFNSSIILKMIYTSATNNTYCAL